MLHPQKVHFYAHTLHLCSPRVALLLPESYTFVPAPCTFDSSTWNHQRYLVRPVQFLKFYTYSVSGGYHNNYYWNLSSTRSIQQHVYVQVSLMGVQYPHKLG
jgi:hypothetical protein